MLPLSRAADRSPHVPAPDARLRSLRLVGADPEPFDDTGVRRPIDWPGTWAEEPTEADGGGWIPPADRTADPAPDVSPGSVPETAPRSLDGVSAVLDRLPLPIAGLLERMGPLGCAVVLAAALLAGGMAAGLLLGRDHPGGAGSAAQSFPALGTSTTGQGAPASAGLGAAPVTAGARAAGGSGPVVVDVEGRVQRPGLVSLPAGARVADAIAAAGGLRGRVHDPSLDLAARVGDGQLLVIGRSARSAAAEASGAGSAGVQPGSASNSTAAGAGSAPLDVNTATETQLEALPGVGPVLAGRILDYRGAHGGFTDVSQLQNVPGIGPSHYAEIAPLVTT